MSKNATVDGLLAKAFELAYFILGDRTISVYVAMAAVDKLKIASTAQDRRFDYIPVGRLTHPAIRTKVRLSEPHLLQRLVYAEAEPFERLLEGQRRSSQEDMIVRFIKHLVRIALRHNSFYMSLGLCRLLYNYTTIETAEIYDCLIQDPDRAKDDYYYRSRKQHLIREMKGRFADSVQTYRGHRGEERFEAQEDSTRYLTLVRECLRRLTPWESQCVLPAEFDPRKNIIAPLLFGGEDPDEEHHIELNRIHTLLHPECFEMLIDQIGLDAPEKRLDIPRFHTEADDQRLTPDRFKPDQLDDDEVIAVKRYLDKNEVHRKAFSGELLSILVDGDPRARFSINQSTGIQFDLADAAESIEVRSFDSDEGIPLSIHLLEYGESGIKPSRFSIIPRRAEVEGFEVQVEPIIGGEIFGTSIRVTPLNVRTNSVVLRMLGSLNLLSPAVLASKRWTRNALIGFVSAVLLIAIAGAGWLLLVKHDDRSSGSLIAKQESYDQLATPPPVPPESMQGQSRSTPKSVSPGPPVQHSSDTNVSKTARDKGSTRRAEWVTDPAILLTVNLVYVDSLGTDAVSRQVREALIANLRSSTRFRVVEKRDDADAVFKGVAAQSGKGSERASLELRLVNAEGRVIWPLKREAVLRRYSGTVDDVSRDVLNILLSDISRLERAR